MPAIGETFAHYRIEGLLGQGGMGQVFLARDEKLRRQVALKVLLTPDGSYAQMMVREARAAAAVEHPNKVTIFELGEVDGTPYIAMELIRGRTLRGLMADSPQPWQEMLACLLDVARALDAAHAAGLVHRDVKPENVMVREDGVVKVLDFGIARRSAGDVDPSASTATATGGGIAGTAAYMPPEQVAGEELDGRCDQFAWGVVAFEVLTGGEHPWGERSNTLKLLSAMLRTPARSLTALRPELPATLTDAVARTLSAEREERFSSMRELVDELAPLVGRPGRDRDAASARSAVHSSPGTAASGGPSGGAPAVAALTAATPSALPGRSKDPGPPAPRARWPWIALALVSAGALAVVLVTQRFALRFGSAPPGAASSVVTTPSSSAASSSSAPSSVAAPGDGAKRPRVHRCHPNLLENIRRKTAIDVSCGDNAYAWCDAEGQTIACCADGLVAAGSSGICVCPPLAGDESKSLGCTDDAAAAARIPAKADADASMVVVHERVRACFREARGTGRSHTLRFWVQFSPYGEAAEVVIMRSDAPDPAMQACALRELAGLIGRVGPGGMSAYEIEWDVGGSEPAPAASASAR